MRRLLGLLFVCALMEASHLSASAQVSEGGAPAESSLDEAATSDDSRDDEGGLSPRLRKRTQRNWDPSTYDVREDPRPGVRYTSVPRESTRRKLPPSAGPSIGLALSVPAFVGGLVMVGVGASQAFCISFGEPCETPRSAPVLIGTGAALTVGGLIGTIVSGMELAGHTNMARIDNEATQAKAQHPRKARRVQWDHRRAQFVF